MKKLDEKDGSSLDLVNEHIKALKDIFPEAVTEDGVNFDTLKQLLSGVISEGEEKFGLNWHGKKQARQIALTPSLGTLRPCPDESVNWDTTENLFIEGDNLEVLKLLQKSYANKVKMIYIDPPYNTGKEFIYPDRFKDNLDTYLRYTGQISDEGFKISSNTESSGRYHTNWLNMMYPRLKLAQNLMRSDGVIFVSIDNNEVHNLRKLMNEIFGEENFIEEIVWEKMYTIKNDAAFISTSHEYIVCFAKNISSLEFGLLARTEDMDARYKNIDDDPRGPWKPIPLYAEGESKNGRYIIKAPNGNEFEPRPDMHWRYREEDMLDLINDNRIYFGRDSNSQPNLKRFLSEVKQGVKARSLWSHEEAGSNDSAKKELKKLFIENEVLFTFPKPTTLVSRMGLLATISNNNDIVLDFFSGSCTTAHAILDLNKEDGGNRKFIMVQLPEPCDEKSEAFKAGYKTIADIGKERIRRVINKIKEEQNSEVQGNLPLSAESEQGDALSLSKRGEVDLGFKVFKLDSSNIRAWNPDAKDLAKSLLDHSEHLVDGRTEEDVLYELLLKRGVELTTPIEKKTISKKSVYSIGYGILFACLADSIKKGEVEALADGIIKWHKELAVDGDTQVVFRDSAFENDVAKTNMTAILEQNGISHVRSL